MLWRKIARDTAKKGTIAFKPGSLLERVRRGAGVIAVNPGNCQQFVTKLLLYGALEVYSED
jgi:hypothetical protein